MNKKAIALYSGGLDSLLAAAIVIRQGIEVIGLHCILPSVDPDINPESLKPSQLAQQINLPLVYYRCDDEYAQVIAHPKHGYGKNANPCIDCKIFFLHKAKEYMNRLNASFVITGEVVGQRPMSQYKSILKHMEKESGLEGLIVRPLSAKLLPLTVPEKEGIIDRQKLYAISGRSRDKQFELAQAFGISQFQSPAGGCFLTMPQIALRVKDLIAHPPFNALDLFLANVGRHYRLHDHATIIVARNERECNILQRYKLRADFFAEPLFKGPVIYGKGIVFQNDYPLLAQFMARYGRPTLNENSVALFIKGQHITTIESHNPIDDSTLTKMRI
jgi:tRNA U34 2-thiouridine synthase MnmA/TrmU